MTFGSLFSGIGGIDLGLERAGMTCKWQIEIDPFCRKVLAKDWPDVRRYENVKSVAGETLEPVDLIAGGFPCQDVSVAGKKAGIKEGTRSGLWFEFHRIICELRPRYVFVENVPGLLIDGMGRVLADLAEIGYDAEWEVLSAADVGAPHLRKRVFITAYDRVPDARGGEIREFGERGGREHAISSPAIVGNDGIEEPMAHTDEAPGQHVCGQQPQQRQKTLQGVGKRGGASMAHPNDTGLQGSRAKREVEGRETATGHSGQGSSEYGRHWAVEPDVGRVAYGVSARVDRLKGLGNAVVPQCAEYIGRKILATVA